MPDIATLGKYIAAGTMCLPKGAGCIAHGLPSTPEWASWTPRATTPATIPILVTMDPTALVFSAGAAAEGVGFAVFAHSIIR
jgi:hypothetical protein